MVPRAETNTYQVIVQNSLDMILIVDALTKEILEVNQSVYRVAGYAPPQILGRFVSELLPVGFDIDVHGAVVEGLDFLRKDGSCCPVDFTAQVIDWEERVVLVLTLRDVSHRRQAAESLKLAEERYHLLFEATRQPMWVYDTQTLRFLDVNQAALGIYGWSHEEFLQMTLGQICASEDFLSFHQKVAPLFEQDYMNCSGGWQHQTKSGAILWVEVCSWPIEFQHRDARMTTIKDITALKQRDQALSQSELRYRRLMETANDAIFIADGATGLILEVNYKAATLVGFTVDELIGQHQSTLHPPELQEEYLQIFRSALQGPAPIGNFLVQHRNGHRIPVEISSSTLELEGRKVIQGIFRDLTERTQREEQLELSARILSTMDTLVLVANAQGDVVFASPSITRTLGYETQEVLGQGWLNLTRPNLQEREQERQYLAAAAGSQLTIKKTPYETMIYDQKGQAHWILWQDTLGPEGMLIGIGQDITEAKYQAKERETIGQQLQQRFEREQLLAKLALSIGQSLNLAEILGTTVHEVRQLLQADRVLIYRFTPQWSGIVEVESVGAGWPSALGFEFFDTCLQEHQGQTLLRGRVKALDNIYQAGLSSCYVELLKLFQVQANLVVPIVQTATRNPSLWGLMIVHQCSEPRAWQNYEIDLLYGLSIHLAIAIQQSELHAQIQTELSERQRAEEDLKKALIKEKELSELKSRFVAMASHEFRTPLTTILSASDLLLHYQARMPIPEQQSLLQDIQTEVQAMTALLEDVLTLGKAEAGKLDFMPEAMDIEAFCWNIFQQAQFNLHSDTLSLQAHFNPCPVVWMDKKLLRHILTNLLSNALKYSPQGGVSTVGLDWQDPDVILTITDEGIGIPEADLSYLFEPFHRATNIGTIPGTGLGLAIVKRAVDIHQGTIKVTSTVGKGTIFRVTLPGNRATR